MKTRTFLLLCLILGMGWSVVSAQKNTKQDEFTKLGAPASIQDKMNGRVQKVVAKLYWGVGKGDKITKGKLITTRERDSLNWFYDFEASFDNIGDHMINYNTLDDNNNPVNKYQFIRENGLIVLSKWTFKEDTKIGSNNYSAGDGYTRFTYDDKGYLIGTDDYSSEGDLLLYSFKLKNNEAGDLIESQTFDNKGNLIRKWSGENNDKRQNIAGVNYGPDGNVRGSYTNTFNDNGKISEAIYFDKDNKVTGKAKYTYLEYDAKGNWTKIGYEFGDYTTYVERIITYFK